MARMFSTMSLQRCLLGALVLSSLVHSCSARQDTQGRNRHPNGRRLHQSNPTTQVQNRVFQSDYGGYVMSIELGTPAQTFTPLLDSGSDLIWVRCLPCTNCTTTLGPVFDTPLSSTYDPILCTSQICDGLPRQEAILETCGPGNGCMFEVAYGSGAVNGTLSTETLTFNGTTIPDITFGCGTEILAGQGLDGLIGLGQGPLLSLPTQLKSSLGISRNFMYCLSPTNSTAGVIIFGDLAIPSASTLFTPIVLNLYNPINYFVALNNISIDGIPVSIPSSAFAISLFDGSGGTIFDSGTTLVLLLPAAYGPLVTALKGAISYPFINGSLVLQINFDLCFNVSGVAQPTFPTITFNFENADFTLPQTNAFIGVGSGVVCLTMASSAVLRANVFGFYPQQGFQIIYDIENSRLGWSGPSLC